MNMEERIEPAGFAPSKGDGGELVFPLPDSDAFVIPEAGVPVSVEPGQSDIIGVLTARYYEALEGARSLPADNWEHSDAPMIEPITVPETYPAGARAPADRAISEWLGAPDSLEQAFGTLHDVDDYLAEPRAVPEILEMFAPVQGRASAAERSARVTPELARREHHTLAIDSPMQQTFGVFARREHVASKGDV
ncbi:hypothetical protein AWB80_01354 [Caballeronia pedi]|uniref:Uncharacterized protein n=1 Tax=Caballeronia pedi TaxID=1777141 RepID=A0A157ZVG4_9BURK|nr:TagK domain-containing protein [Caballeronia pedi]SAK49495.1 hypothetical protein AWB80_01354 [Caballeronia pedi]